MRCRLSDGLGTACASALRGKICNFYLASFGRISQSPVSGGFLYSVISNPRDTLSELNRMKNLYYKVVVAFALGYGSAFASTDPADIVTAASGKYDTAVAVFIGAAVIGAAILYIRKGLRGRM